MLQSNGALGKCNVTKKEVIIYLLTLLSPPCEGGANFCVNKYIVPKKEAKLSLRVMKTHKGNLVGCPLWVFTWVVIPP